MDELHELTAAYALDALEPDEARAYEAHLDTCPRCREELAGLAGTASALAYAAAGPQPPAELRGRILETARAERQNVVPLRARRPLRLTPLVGIAAAAACLLVGLGIWNLSLHRDLDHKSAIAAVLGDPRATHVALPNAAGQLVVSKKGVALIANVKPAPKGKTYEAWMIPRGGKPVPAGTFDRGGAVLLHGTPSPGVTMAVTIEKHGGSAQPTTQPVVSMTLA
jgi:anti-sigma-K factor RskA